MNAIVWATARRARFVVLCNMMDAISGKTPKECCRTAHRVFDDMSEAIETARERGVTDPEVDAFRREKQMMLIARCGLCTNRCKEPLT